MRDAVTQPSYGCRHVPAEYWLVLPFAVKRPCFSDGLFDKTFSRQVRKQKMTQDTDYSAFQTLYRDSGMSHHFKGIWYRIGFANYDW